VASWSNTNGLKPDKGGLEGNRSGKSGGKQGGTPSAPKGNGKRSGDLALLQPEGLKLKRGQVREEASSPCSEGRGQGRQKGELVREPMGKVRRKEKRFCEKGMKATKEEGNAKFYNDIAGRRSKNKGIK